MTKGILRFFFDYGAGGCLWAGNEETLSKLGSGPVDAEFVDVDGRIKYEASLILPEQTRQLIQQLDFEHSGYLNPLYPPDPSLWTQACCDRFNQRVDVLLRRLQHLLSDDYDIVDEQVRYIEDPELRVYLADNPGLNAVDKVTKPTVS
ncbi:hypothetical protein [Thalassospira lucentensis]|uniref:hypothetical protein n=1 Tax=Thalassospira lucentensis TaxID=168935 RepID=UPI00142E7F64|nr:hypothetical protein [Thalassospira lucentensis]NIZ01597.1 hypothetical protein [Thalassospira lucentensis]